ncbi:MAG: rRNA maturation RNase YbeY [Acidobacteria bacterium]|nr:rRNA maturation RNase YbeY [Acidobacteriota bacterium]
MHEIYNNQRKVKVSRRAFEKFLESIFDSIEETRTRSAVIALVSDRKMRGLNRDFRGKDATTDVLSFPFEPDEFDSGDNLGDIVISVEQAARQATENGLDLESEIKQLILHGVLHLCGYDHETDDGEMNSRELGLREMFGI